MNRQIVLKISTTGSKAQGNGISEIAAIELINGKEGNSFHQLLNPEHEFENEAVESNKMSLAELIAYPTFDRIADDFLAFINNDELIVQNKNSNFELNFLNQALLAANKMPLEPRAILCVDSLYKQKHPHSWRFTKIETMSQAVDVGINRIDGAQADYLCDRLCKTYLRLKDKVPARRENLRPRFNINGHHRVLPYLADIPKSDFFKHCSAKRKWEEVQQAALDGQNNVVDGDQSFQVSSASFK